MKEQITQLRQEIDRLFQTTDELMPLNGDSFGRVGNTQELFRNAKFNSIPINDSCKSLLLAKAWLGKVLGQLGNENPYKNNGNRHSVEDIEPTSDKVEAKQFTGLNHIEKVDHIREEIQKVIDTIKAIEFTEGLDFGDEKDSEKEDKLYEQANECNYLAYASYQHLVEARFHLGFELERIRKQK